MTHLCCWLHNDSCFRCDYKSLPFSTQARPPNSSRAAGRQQENVLECASLAIVKAGVIRIKWCHLWGKGSRGLGEDRFHCWDIMFLITATTAAPSLSTHSVPAVAFYSVKGKHLLPTDYIWQPYVSWQKPLSFSKPLQKPLPLHRYSVTALNILCRTRISLGHQKGSCEKKGEMWVAGWREGGHWAAFKFSIN